MNISKNIIDLRESKGIKQYEVAEKLGIDPPNYSRLEKRGEKLTIEQLKKIADALGVSFLEFFEVKNKSTENNADLLKRVTELEKWIKDKEFIINNLKLSVYTLQELVESFFDDLEWSVAEHLKIGHVKINNKIEEFDFDKGVDYYPEEAIFILTEEDKRKIVDFVYSNDLLLPLISDFRQYQQDMGIDNLWTQKQKSPIKVHNKDFLHKDLSLGKYIDLKHALGEL